MIQKLDDALKKGLNYNKLIYLDLIDCRKYNICILHFYLENLINNNVTIKTSYYKTLNLLQDTFNPILKGNYMYYNYKNIKEIFFFIPCYGNCTIIYSSFNKTRKTENFLPFFKYVESEPYDSITINNNFLSLINYYRINDNEEFYTFNEYDNNLIPFNCYIVDNKHLRVEIYELFSNAPQIDYTLIISPNDNNQNENLFESQCNFFYYFYYNNLTISQDIEIYRFSIKDIKNEKSKNNIIYYIDLPLPTKINIKYSNKAFKYKLMGITGPKYKFVKTYGTLYDRECPEGKVLDKINNQCVKKNKFLNTKFTIIFCSIGFLIILILCLTICCKCKKQKKEKHFSQQDIDAPILSE